MIVSPPGSGKSVVISDIAKSATKRNGHVLFLVHRKELIDQITNSFKFHEVDLSKVDLLTVGKAKNRLKELTKPTLIITDEGHHGKANTYQIIYDYFSDVQRLGFTATPWRLSALPTVSKSTFDRSTSWNLKLFVIWSINSFLWTKNKTCPFLLVADFAMSDITTDLPLPGGLTIITLFVKICFLAFCISSFW
jgi:hypothetical protein